LACRERIYIIGIRSGASYLQHLVIHNSGVEITTNEATARAVLWRVVSIMVLSPVNKAVMIQHGLPPYIKTKFGVCEQRDKISIKQSEPRENEWRYR
jgi:hypothetical protein